MVSDRQLPFLLEQPLHPFHGLLDEFLARRKSIEHRPEPMGKARIHVHLRLDPLFLAQNSLVNQSLVSQRIRAADLEEGWRQSSVARFEDKRTEQLAAAVGMVWYIVVEEEIAGYLGENCSVFVLLPRMRVFPVLFWQFRVDADGRDHQVSTSERRTELLVASQVGNCCGEVTACRIAANDESFTWVCTKLGSVLGSLDLLATVLLTGKNQQTYPFHRIPAVIVRCRESMFGRKAIVHTDDNKAKFPTQQAAKQILALKISNAPAAAVDHEVQWSASLFRRISSHSNLLVIAHRNLLVFRFFHSGDRTPGRSGVLLGGGEKFTETLDIGEGTNVEGLTSHGLDNLYCMSMGLPNNG